MGKEKIRHERFIGTEDDFEFVGNINKIIITKGELKMAKKKKKRKAATRMLGRNSGVGLFDTWVLMFTMNAKKRLTDNEILKIMKAEFPGRAAKSKVFNSVATHRALYHRGILTHGVRPKKKSKQYE